MTTIAEQIEAKKAAKEQAKAEALQNAVDTAEFVDSVKSPLMLNADEALAIVSPETAKVAYYAAFAECGFRYNIKPQKDVSAMIADFGMLLLGFKETSQGQPIKVKDGEAKFAEFKQRFVFWAELLARLTESGEYRPPVTEEDKLIALLRADLPHAIERGKEAGYSLTAITNALQRIAMGG